MPRACSNDGVNLFDVVRAHEELVERIQEVVRSTLRIHSRSAIKVLPVHTEGLPGPPDVAIIGVLRLTGVPAGNSLLALGLSYAAFAEIYENMFGEPYVALSEDSGDIAGELVNIIFQSIDPDLRELGLELEPSLPAFLTGRAIDGWSQATLGPTVVLPFSLEAGDLFVAIPDLRRRFAVATPPDLISVTDQP